jgi:hypothetical protein
MPIESQLVAVKPRRHRHPATVLVLGLFVASEVYLNLWFVAPRWRGSVIVLAGLLSTNTSHGYPAIWLFREFEAKELYGWTDEYRAAEEQGDRLSLGRQNLRIALPWELLIGDFSRASFRFWRLVIDAAVGIGLFFALRKLGDRCFGTRSSPTHRWTITISVFATTMVALGVDTMFDVGLWQIAERYFASCAVVVVLGAFFGVSAWIVEKERLRARAKIRWERRRRLAAAAR